MTGQVRRNQGPGHDTDKGCGQDEAGLEREREPNSIGNSSSTNLSPGERQSTGAPHENDADADSKAGLELEGGPTSIVDSSSTKLSPSERQSTGASHGNEADADSKVHSHRTTGLEPHSCRTRAMP